MIKFAQNGRGLISGLFAAVLLPCELALAEQSVGTKKVWTADVKFYGSVWKGAHPSKSGKPPQWDQAQAVETDLAVTLWIGDDGIPYIESDGCVAALFPAQPDITLQTGGQFVADLAYAGSSPRCGLPDDEEIVEDTLTLTPEGDGYIYAYSVDQTFADPYKGWGRLYGSAVLQPSDGKRPASSYADRVPAPASPPAQTKDSDLAAIIDKVIKADSSGWLFNRYDRGSVTNATFLEKSEDGENGIAYGEYTYNGGSPGWIKIVMQDSAVKCMEYWDFAGRCRPFGSASSGSQLAMDLAIAAATMPPSSGGSSGSGENCREVLGGLDPNGRPIVLGYECR